MAFDCVTIPCGFRWGPAEVVRVLSEKTWATFNNISPRDVITVVRGEAVPLAPRPASAVPEFSVATPVSLHACKACGYHEHSQGCPIASPTTPAPAPAPAVEAGGWTRKIPPSGITLCHEVLHDTDNASVHRRHRERYGTMGVVDAAWWKLVGGGGHVWWFALPDSTSATGYRIHNFNGKTHESTAAAKHAAEAWLLAQGAK